MSSQADEEILFQAKKNAGFITLNRPKALNALNLNMVRMMQVKMDAWEKDPNVGLVVIRGAGGKAFCAGGDILSVTEAGKKGDPLPQNFFREEYILNHKIGTYAKPYVAIIHGITMGGGVGLSVHGRFRVCTERTMFAMPECAIGLFPDVGGGHFLPQLEGKLGVFLALTGFRLKGRDVQKVGIATHFVDSTKLGDLEEKLSTLSSSAGVSDVAAVLDDFHQQSPQDLAKEMVLAPQIENINRLFAGETLEAIFADLEKDGSEWALKQLDLLSRMSPTSMKITLRLLLEGQGRTLAEDLNVEYRLSQRCCEDKDFYEGVRAVLVDKDHSPQWNPGHIKEVSNDKVEWYFSPLPAKRELIL